MVFISLGYLVYAYINTTDPFINTGYPKVTLNIGYGFTLGTAFISFFLYTQIMYEAVMQGTIYKKLKYYFYAFFARILLLTISAVLNITFYVKVEENETFLVFSSFTILVMIVCARPRMQEISEDLILTNPELTYIRNPEKDFFDE